MASFDGDIVFYSNNHKRVVSCPECGSEWLIRYGVNRSGTKRFCCQACGKVFTFRPKLSGRPRIDPSKVLSEAERQRRCRAKREALIEASNLLDA